MARIPQAFLPPTCPGDPCGFLKRFFSPSFIIFIFLCCWVLRSTAQAASLKNVPVSWSTPSQAKTWLRSSAKDRATFHVDLPLKKKRETHISVGTTARRGSSCWYIWVIKLSGRIQVVHLVNPCVPDVILVSLTPQLKKKIPQLTFQAPKK